MFNRVHLTQIKIIWWNKKNGFVFHKSQYKSHLSVCTYGKFNHLHSHEHLNDVVWSHVIMQPLKLSQQICSTKPLMPTTSQTQKKNVVDKRHVKNYIHSYFFCPERHWKPPNTRKLITSIQLNFEKQKRIKKCK